MCSAGSCAWCNAEFVFNVLNLPAHCRQHLILSLTHLLGMNSGCFPDLLSCLCLGELRGVLRRLVEAHVLVRAWRLHASIIGFA